LLLPVIWLVAKRQRARTADSERELHFAHTTGLSVSLRCCWCCERSRSPLDDTVSQSELPHSMHTDTDTLQLHASLHMYVPCRFELLSSFSTTIEDVSPSQF
jgi:hypothetical protein